MKRSLCRLLVILCPAFALWWVMQVLVLPRYHADRVGESILIALAAVVVLGLCEIFALRAWVLPTLSKWVQYCIYGGGGAEDALCALANRMRKHKDRSLLPELIQAVENDPSRTRAWSELAAVHEEVMNDPAEAIRTLLQGAEKVSDPQDRAMLIYRAARLRESALNDAIGAKELMTQAAARYPKTVYGKLALSSLTTLRSKVI
jgi:hypothetical protein